MNLIDEVSDGLSVRAAYKLLYGHEATIDVLDTLAQVLQQDKITSLADLRKILLCLDRQTHPSPATVRFGVSDLHTTHIEGFNLIVDLADFSVSGPIINQGRWEPHLTGVFRRYIKPKWRVADIGANIGYYAMLAASIVGNEGEVFAFEPNSENARLILLNVAKNNFSDVRLFPFALSDMAGHAYFSSFVGSNGGFLEPDTQKLADGRGIVVPTVTLDSLLHSPVDFMKLDVEGAEYRVLRGGMALLSSARPIVTIEFSCEMLSRVSDVEPREVLCLFLNYGYLIYLIDKATGVLHHVDDVDRFLSSWGQWDRIEDLLMLPNGNRVLQPQN